MSYSGIRILTVSPGAWPWATTRLRFGGGGTVRKESPSLLGPFGPPVGAAFLFLSPPVGRGASSSSSSSSSGEECAAESSDGESDDAWRWELFRVPLAFLVFSGTG